MTLTEVKQMYLDRAVERPHGYYVVADPTTGQIAAHSNQPFRHTFDGGNTWVEAQRAQSTRYQSADGLYYLRDDLPENTDQFVSELYAQTVRAERNARIEDTDDYIRLSDVTVEKVEGEPREPLTAEEHQAVMDYREALRNLPEQEGFPFVDYPAIPEAIRVECGRKIAQREMMTTSMGEYR